jgi:hypothetical protein
MTGEKLTLLNTSILTEFGTYVYAGLTTEAARALVREYLERGLAVESAVGHEATAELLSLLLDHPVAVNRVEFRQRAGDVALVFKLRARPPEGAVLGRGELEAIGYDLGLLTRSE